MSLMAVGCAGTDFGRVAVDRAGRLRAGKPPTQELRRRARDQNEPAFLRTMTAAWKS